VSQDGPAESGPGWYRTARMRRTTSLLTGMPNANVICCAIRGQPHVGFRRFISTTAAMMSWVGPFGPGFFGTFDENSRRYFRLVSARCKFKSVAGFRTIADRTSRLGRMRSAHKPATMRSEERRLGHRLRETLEDEQLLFDEHGFGHDRAGAAGTSEPGERGQEMEKQNGQVAHGESYQAREMDEMPSRPLKK
jgi:hypothetical protein